MWCGLVGRSRVVEHKQGQGCPEGLSPRLERHHHVNLLTGVVLGQHVDCLPEGLRFLGQPCDILEHNPLSGEVRDIPSHLCQIHTSPVCTPRTALASGPMYQGQPFPGKWPATFHKVP